MSAPLATRIADEFARVAPALPDRVVSRSRREHAIKVLLAQGLPISRDENWRYANLRALERIRFAPPTVASRALTLADLPPAIEGYERYTYVDGVLVASLSSAAGGERPFLMGHSLGGTLAAIFCAVEPLSAQGLVLLSAPLCFEQASSRFRDALISIVPTTLSETDIVAGSLLSQVSAVASPDTFVWSRWLDAALSLADPAATDLHVRVERWALDEVALPGKLVNHIVQWLYRENRLCRGTLSVCGITARPANVRSPVLAIVNPADEIGPLVSVVPFIDQMATTDAQVIACENQIGVGLQHLGMLAGRQAYVHVWPQIVSWVKARC